jgi:hypothetical protein
VTGIDRHSVSAFVQACLSALPSAPLVRDVAPAAIPIRLASNSEALFESYISRLVGQPAIAPGIQIAASVTPNLPVWTDETCPPQRFHQILSEHGLRAAYPFRPGLWQMLDPASGVGAQLADDVARLPPWDAGAPLRQHLHWLLRLHDRRVMHASSLGEGGKGVLFVGNAGTGKSGMALAGLSVGLSTVGDDYLSVGNEAGEVVARPLYRIIKQDRLGLSRVPQLAAKAGCLAVNWKGKVELDPEHYFPTAFADRLEVKAIAIPRIAQARTPSLAETGKGEAMRALMRSNLHQFPGEGDDGMAFYGDVLRRLPVFTIDLSQDFPANGELVRRLIQSL